MMQRLEENFGERARNGQLGVLALLEREAEQLEA
jgi:hypothetical protein